MEEKKVVLECKNLNKFFGRKQILSDVSFELREGDILGFIGPNGAGKTTTIKLILGLQSITSGNVLINGYDVQKQFTKAIKKVGAIVENPDLYMYLTGYENLKLIANLYKEIGKERIDEVVKLVNLEKRINDKVSKYSLGMRQRLGIAQAILHKPKLLILDEPTNGLDPEGIKEMRELLIELAEKEKMAILISSHNLAELDTFCNKICIIKNGKIIETIIFRVDSTKNVTQIFADKNYDLKVLDKRQFKINVEEAEIPKIVVALVKNDVKVYEIKHDEKSLEQAFLEKTGGNVIE